MSLQDCIDTCVDCHRVCLETATHCMAKGGSHATEPHLRLLADCAQICQTSADFMIRGSDLHILTCRVCAEVCERCAQDCFGYGDDPQMKRCAEICRECAASCRMMTT